MPIVESLIFRWLLIPYSPRSDAREFLETAVTQKRDDFEVRVAVLDDAESRKFFGVPLARRGIQPVWVHVINRTPETAITDSPVCRATRSEPLFSARGCRGQSLLGRETAAWLRPLGVAVSGAADPTADQVIRRTACEPEDGCVFPEACLPHASDSSRRRTGGVRLHEPIGREQDRSRAIAWPGRLSGLRVLHAGRGPPHRLSAARFRCSARGRSVDRSGYAAAANRSICLRRRRLPPTAMGGGQVIRSTWSSSA